MNSIVQVKYTVFPTINLKINFCILKNEKFPNALYSNIIQIYNNIMYNIIYIVVLTHKCKFLFVCFF